MIVNRTFQSFPFFSQVEREKRKQLPRVSENLIKQNFNSILSQRSWLLCLGGHSQTPGADLLSRRLSSVSRHYGNIRWADIHCARAESSKSSSDLIRSVLPNLPLMERDGGYRSEFAQKSKKLFGSEDRASVQPLPVQDPWLLPHMSEMVSSEHCSQKRTPSVPKVDSHIKGKLTSHKVPCALNKRWRFWGIFVTVLDFSILIALAL